MGQIGVADVTAPSELQYTHAGEREGSPQMLDIRGDGPEVLCDDGQRPERTFQRIEQRLTGTGHPLAVHGCRFVDGDTPVSGESTEMVDT